MSRQERRLKPGKDIGPLDSNENNIMHDYLRAKVKSLTPHIISGISIDQLKDSWGFDYRIAEKIQKHKDCPEEMKSANIRDVALAVSWYRHGSMGAEKPTNPPPSFLPSLDDVEYINLASKENIDGEMVHLSTCEPEYLSQVRERIAQKGPNVKFIGEMVKEYRSDIMKTFTVNDFENPDVIDNGLKDLILREASCPENITKLSKERPSVFDIYASCHKYNPNFVSLAVKLQNEKTSAKSGMDYYEYFKRIHPNSKNIIRDLRMQAYKSQQNTSKNNVNME